MLGSSARKVAPTLLQRVPCTMAAASIHPPIASFKTSFVGGRDSEGFFKRMVRKVGWLNHSRSRLKASGFLLYEQCTDQVDSDVFMNELNMPDTMFSWFLVTELHCWLLITRSMAEGDEGRTVRNGTVEALWQDVGTRIQKLQVPHRSQILQELSDQFRAAIIGYDEGLQSSDVVLAGALWRRLLSRDNKVTPQQLEMVVSFVRKQMAALDKLPSKDILLRPKVNWLPLIDKS